MITAQSQPFRVTEGGEYAGESRGSFPTLIEARKRARKLSISSGTICCIWHNGAIIERYANGQRQGPQA